MRRIVIAMFLSLASVQSFVAPTAAAQSAPTAASATPYTTEDTPVGEILDDPEAAAIIDKYVTGFSTAPQVDMARAMTLKEVQQYAADSFTDEVLKSIDSDFAALAAKRKKL